MNMRERQDGHLTERIATGRLPIMKAKQSQKLKLTDQLRSAVENCGKTRYRISKETGISEVILSRLMSRERFLSSDNLDILAEYLGLELRTVAQKPCKEGK